MQTPQPGTGTGTARPAGGGQRALTGLGYLLLLVLGLLEGGIGAFQYGQPPTPLIAALLAVIVFVTCAGCGWGIGSVTGALLPAVGWIVAAFVLAMGRPNGSVIITASAAGEWFLYGGALACVLGVFAVFFARIRRPAGRVSR
jgi:hypothetical protein